MNTLKAQQAAQAERNQALLADTIYCQDRIESKVFPWSLDLSADELSDEKMNQQRAIEKLAAKIAIESLIDLAVKEKDLDHLGGGLDLIPALIATLGVVDYDAKHYTIEHAHTSIGYYSSLAALGFLDQERVVNVFRRSLDIAGHVSWVPGGTELNGGRLGIMVPVAVGQALGAKAHHGDDALVFVHTGDAGWISGQALNGFVDAGLHGAPMVFIMHRNGIQLSDTTEKVMNLDPRPIVEAMGVKIVETTALCCPKGLFKAYKEAADLAKNGQPAMVYPVGLKSSDQEKVTLATLGELAGIGEQVEAFAAKNEVATDKEIWIPGSLMSYRDVPAMLECVFHVNDLPGGKGHHDGGMNGRDHEEALASPMLVLTDEEQSALDAMKAADQRVVVTEARPSKGTANLTLTAEDLADVNLPGTEKAVSPRAGSEAGYVAIAKKYPEAFFTVSCDLDPSTKFAKAKALIADDHKFEVSIQEQVATLMTSGLACSSRKPQVNVVATFSAFFEGIAREGFELWRYQRNLNGVNEGLNVIMHLSHVGACTGRDHFSGWSLDWIPLGLGYLPYLRGFYTPADARAAFIAVKDAAAGYGGHIVAIPRDNLPILTKQGTDEPLFNATDDFTPTSQLRSNDGAKVAIVSVGAPTYVAVEAADKLAGEGTAADVYCVNGFPVADDFFDGIAEKYDGVVTVEDGLIGDRDSGVRGFAAYAATRLYDSHTPVSHIGICDPSVAPSEHFHAVWEHFGITADNIAVEAKALLG
jgi:transketolase